VRRADSIERLEDQTHDVLDLLIGIEDHLAGLPTQIPGGDRLAQLASTSLLKLSLEQRNPSTNSVRLRTARALIPRPASGRAAAN
jgi:hypothetical protein